MPHIKRIRPTNNLFSPPVAFLRRLLPPKKSVHTGCKNVGASYRRRENRKAEQSPRNERFGGFAWCRSSFLRMVYKCNLSYIVSFTPTATMRALARSSPSATISIATMTLRSPATFPSSLGHPSRRITFSELNLFQCLCHTDFGNFSLLQSLHQEEEHRARHADQKIDMHGQVWIHVGIEFGERRG